MGSNDLWTSAPPTGLCVVVGSYPDGSGMSEVAYGVYTEATGARIADELSSGGWSHMRWTALPLTRTPWDPS